MRFFEIRTFSVNNFDKSFIVLDFLKITSRHLWIKKYDCVGFSYILEEKHICSSNFKLFLSEKKRDICRGPLPPRDIEWDSSWHPFPLNVLHNYRTSPNWLLPKTVQVWRDKSYIYFDDFSKVFFEYFLTGSKQLWIKERFIQNCSRK